ncbi:MAG: FixH family protein [Niabella sp.]
MSWGYKVIITLVVFLAGMSAMVYIAMRQTNEIIDSNYYEREIKYQRVIDAKNNLLKLKDTVSMHIRGPYVLIGFPESAVGKIDSGKIEFVKLSDSKADRTFEMNTTNGPSYKIPVTALEQGWYTVRMEWQNNGTGYYLEQNFNVQ